MPYNFIADSFHIKKLCSRISSSEVRFYTKNDRFAFLSSLWGLWATYDVHLRLIGKRVVNFLLVLIEIFSLGVTAEGISVENRRFLSNGVSLTQNFSRRGRPSQTFFLSQHYSEWSFMWYKNVGTFFSFCHKSRV